jgi:hypothetical protein
MTKQELQEIVESHARNERELGQVDEETLHEQVGKLLDFIAQVAELKTEIASRHTDELYDVCPGCAEPFGPHMKHGADCLIDIASAARKS